jgi:hypothetical protein
MWFWIVALEAFQPSKLQSSLAEKVLALSKMHDGIGMVLAG